eukprot:1748339-Lingulodinium_polyedra.AAC.1
MATAAGAGPAPRARGAPRRPARAAARWRREARSQAALPCPGTRGGAPRTVEARASPRAPAASSRLGRTWPH